MSRIALVSLNARYSHASLGVRYLRANLGALRDQSAIMEFTLQESAELIAARILAMSPAIIAIGVYIWNRTQVEELVGLLRSLRPAVPIVLGGPEIAYDTESPLADSVDCVICGEADLAFESVCIQLLAGQEAPHIVNASKPDLHGVRLPYAEYANSDIATRTIYAETSRGCAYGCEYCISSINPGIRLFPLHKILPEFMRLIERGARRFKFVDRSFNLYEEHACEVLSFFLSHWCANMCLHFEMTPDRIPSRLRAVLMSFPPGGLHIETGVQTFSPDVAGRVGRNTNHEAAEEGIRFLVDVARADVHADLIAGLPGETPEMFEKGMNRLMALHPSELQVGILKKLHGAAIKRHEAEWSMQFRHSPPYDILSTSTMDAEYLNGIRRFAMHWDRIMNRKWFPLTTSLLLNLPPSPFEAFDQFSRRLEEAHGRFGFGMVEASKVLLSYLTGAKGLPMDQVQECLRKDYLADGKRINVPSFLHNSGRR